MQNINSKFNSKSLFLLTLYTFSIVTVFGFTSIVIKHECTLTSYNRGNCYEHNGARYLELYYNVNNNTSVGVIECGIVIDCNTSRCIGGFIPTINGTYYCYSKSNLLFIDNNNSIIKNLSFFISGIFIINNFNSYVYKFFI